MKDNFILLSLCVLYLRSKKYLQRYIIFEGLHCSQLQSFDLLPHKVSCGHQVGIRRRRRISSRATISSSKDHRFMEIVGYSKPYFKRRKSKDSLLENFDVGWYLLPLLKQTYLEYVSSKNIVKSILIDRCVFSEREMVQFLVGNVQLKKPFFFNLLITNHCQ